VTSILGVFNTAAYGPGELAFRNALAADRPRAGETVRVHVEFPAILGVAHGAIEPAPLALHPLSFAIDDGYVVLADATLYRVTELCAALGGCVRTSASPSELILAAYRAFGSECVNQIDGDFAFLVWDRRRRTVFCARDFTGRRPLFLAPWRGGLIAASSLDSIAALPGFDPQVDLTSVGADAAGLLFSQDDQTCMRGVRSLRAGHTAQWSAGENLLTRRFWHPLPETNRDVSFDDAALELRRLLICAVSERVSTSGPTAVWMSGGRDSTAVFAAGMEANRRGTADSVLHAICRTHPPGDSGREDKAINEIAQFWRVTPDWVDAKDTPLFGSQRDRTRWSAEPFGQPFEGLSRALARKARSVGASVALDGYGGDFLFQVSRVYLSDLIAAGRLVQAVREWRSMDGGKEGRRGFFHYALRPLLPRWANRAVALARSGRTLRASMERIPPPWIRAEFLREQGILDRFTTLGPDAQKARSAADREILFYLTHQFFARVNAKLAGFALDVGVELRSPLLDQRVVQFALSRPREERNSAGDHKRLLRASMRGLLPDSTLGARRAKTGTLASYFAHNMQGDGLRLLAELRSSRALADAGIMEPREFDRAVARYRVEGASYPFAESLYCTLQAEAWLTARNAGFISRHSVQERVGAI
jgi:asparagine synthase (glutamine-hydrolysing)